MCGPAVDHLHELLVVRDDDELEVGLLLAVADDLVDRLRARGEVGMAQVLIIVINRYIGD